MRNSHILQNCKPAVPNLTLGVIMKENNKTVLIQATKNFMINIIV